MGQQQLLLLVIGMVITAVAILAGLAAIPAQMRQSEADNLINRNLEIATAATAWKSLRDPYNGGNTAFSGLNTDGFTKLFMEATTHRGRFEINSPSAFKLQITSQSIRYPDVGTRTFVTNYDVDSTIVKFDGTYEVD